MQLSDAEVERFNAKVWPEPMSGCHLWGGAVKANGYGVLTLSGSTRLAHRVAYTIAHGPIPRGEGFHGTCVLHRCDVPACVNPEHLFLGTQADNMRDMDRKGRRAQPRGEVHWHTTLTERDVRIIRKWRALGGTLRCIADSYGVSSTTVHHVVTRQTWRHIA